MDQANTSTQPLRRRLMIVNQLGLHARAAAKFVKLAGQFEAEITVSRGENEVSGLSIMGLMMLAAAQGCEIDVAVSGPDAANALGALDALIAARFDED